MNKMLQKKVKMQKQKPLMFMAAFALSTMGVWAEKIQGTVIDKESREPLAGVVVHAGTGLTAMTGDDGKYILNVKPGLYSIKASYLGYKPLQMDGVRVSGDTLTVNLEMEVSELLLDAASVVVRRNLENSRALQNERQNSTLAIENIGTKEMSIKGLSNVQEGVKKMTGISFANSGQLIVRGLGDRYSITTLNGLPIASPNPDNKLIPLDLFPVSTVRNITVRKVYGVNSFADYSGAHIDISTKESVGQDFLNFSFSTGGRFNTLFQDFYSMDRDVSLFRQSGLDEKYRNMSKAEFSQAVRQENPFRTSFDVSRSTSLPEFGGSLTGGTNWELFGRELYLLGAMSVGNTNETTLDASTRTLEAGGSTLDRYTYDEYRQELKLSALANLSYALKEADRVGYTFFYARNAENSYMLRQGRDWEDHELVGNNNVSHIYTLQNHQLTGKHGIGDSWDLNWNASYSHTASDEPDRRQLMFEKKDDGTLELFQLNRQETMRYFGFLDEKEWVADLQSAYRFAEKNQLRFGAAYKDKSRRFRSTRFYYNFSGFHPQVEDIYHTSGFLNHAAVAAGDFSIERDQQPKDQYDAGQAIYAGYVDTEFYPLDGLLINAGVRYEYSSQLVDYATDGAQKRRNKLNNSDLFPALNIKYNVNDGNSVRMSLSRTVTRPSFIEMAPFLYQESYGASMIRGNAELKNGYNYNFDLRYERIDREHPERLLSVTGYAKILKDPIERTQTLSGGAAEHSFQNADAGVAAGVEVEFRREIFGDFRIGFNGSYMYTNVKLPSEGVYTNQQRSLQGASPYLMNIDLSYAPTFRNGSQLTAMLLYNLQGERIHAVGISGLGDEKQDALHTLNFVSTYRMNDRVSLKMQLNDLLGQDIVFRQATRSGKSVEVERYGQGTSIEIGVSCQF